MSFKTYMNIKTQFDNVGDALIIRELLKLVSKRSETIVDASRCPVEFIETITDGQDIELKIVSNGFLFLLFRMAADIFKGHSVYYFLIPGALFGEKTLRAYLTSLLTCLIMFGMKLSGVRICQIGISYDHLGPKHLSILQTRNRMLFKSMVRDPISYAYASQLGIRVDGILPDLAFNLSAVKDPLKNRDAIAFSFRADKYAGADETLMNAVLKIVELIPSEVRIILVLQVKRDRPYMWLLKSKIEKSTNRGLEFVEHFADIEKCRAVYTGCTHIFSNRLHGLLLALSVGAKPIAVINPKLDEKIIGVYQYMGKPALVLDAASLTEQEISVALNDAFDFDLSRPKSDLKQFFDQLYLRSDLHNRSTDI